MIHDKISCLMATYGRYFRVCEALACFLRQGYANRELVILNNHPVPMAFDHPLVRVVNEPIYPTLGHCRNRLLDFADGEFMRLWDDDDLYFPWCISQGVERIGAAPAWKPTRSWWYNGQDAKFALAANAMEASITWRTDFVRRIGFHTGNGDESKTLLGALGNAGPASDEMGEWAGYCYTWGCGEYHASGTIGNGQPDDVRAAAWKHWNQDARPGVPLMPKFGEIRRWQRQLVRQLPITLQSPWMAAALGYGPAHAPPIKAMSKVLTVANRRPHGGRLVVAPGCWDVLHPGHVELLRWASTQGDALAVLVNDDAGVAAQKGSGRPLVPLKGRIAALAAQTSVSAIFVVDGADALPLLTALTPAVLVKGPDYAGRAAGVPRPPNCEVRIAPASEYMKHTSDLIGVAA